MDTGASQPPDLGLEDAPRAGSSQAGSDDVRASRAMSPSSAIAALVGADCLEEALDELDNGLRSQPPDQALLSLRGSVAERLRLATAVIDQDRLLVLHFPNRPEHHVRLIERLLSSGLTDAALAAIRAAGPLLGSQAPLLVARAELGRADPQGAVPALEAALVDARSTDRTGLASLLLQAGALQRAREVIETTSRAPDDVEAGVLHATYALWSGDVTRATELSRAIAPDAPGRARFEAALAPATGRYGEAIESGARAIRENHADFEALLLHAIAHWLAGRRSEAERLASAARYAPGAWRNSYTVLVHELMKSSRPSPAEWDELRTMLSFALGGAAQPGAFRARFQRRLQRRARRRWLAELPARVGWNFSSVPTRVVRAGKAQVRWEPVQARRDSRSACATTLDLVEMLPYEAICARFDELAADRPSSPFPFTHRAELHAWFGSYGKAEADCRRALALDSQLGRFAWVSLAGALTWQGRLREAEKVLGEAKKWAAPALLSAYRGETRLLQGDRQGAKEDLTVASRLAPARVSSKLLLGLVAYAEGDLEGLRAVHRRLCELLPELARSARREQGAAGEFGLTPEAMASLLRTALSVMRGNRSSHRMTWLPADGRLRIMAPAIL